MNARGDLSKIPTSSKTGDLYGGQLINKNVTISEKQLMVSGKTSPKNREDLPQKNRAVMVLQPNLLFRAEVICRTVVRLRAGKKNDQLPYIIVQCTMYILFDIL